MRTLTVSIDPDDDHAHRAMMEHARRALAEGDRGSHQGFANMRQLFEVFTPKRWELVETLQRIGPSSLRGLARAVGRDVKRVHGDVGVLIDEHVVERDGAGKLTIPFAEIRIDIRLRTPPP